MRRRPRFRAASVVLSLLFALVATDVGSLHACPMHGAGMVESHATAAGHDGHMAHAAEHSSAQRSSHGETPDHGSSHRCTCVGPCCGAAPAVAPTAPASFSVVETTADVAPGRPDHEYVAAWARFVLPFATAPPARPVA